MKTTLYYQQGTSDKIYIIEKVEVNGGFAVNFAYGRRGATLKTGTKTETPVSEGVANQVFAQLKQEKMGKGYLEGLGMGGYTSSQAAPTNINVQLLNAVEQTELESLFADDEIGGQEKFDGKRMVLVLEKGEIYGVNRTSLRCGMPTSFTQIIEQLKNNCQQVFRTDLNSIIIDGEAEGDVFKAFDLLEINGVDLKSQPYFKRWERLKTIVFGGGILSAINNLECADLARGEKEKRELFARLQQANLEGIVFKKLSAPYEAGRPASGGNQLKFKFCAEATCLVAGQNGTKRSISLQVLEADGSFRDIGNCTIPVNHSIPQVGSLVEIRYLYAYPNGSLFQPVYKGERSDKQSPDSYQSLKFKAQTAMAA